MTRFAAGFASGAVAGAFLAVVLLAGIGHALAVSDPLEPADAIVAISGDTGARVRTAVELWHRGYGDVIVFSGGSEDPRSAPSAELMKRQAMALGVPDDKILLETGSTSTDENAVKVATLMRAEGLRSAILVTSPYHQRRASLLFERAFTPYGLTFLDHPAADPTWDPDTWWLREPARSRTLVELAKIAVEGAGGRLTGAATTP